MTTQEQITEDTKPQEPKKHNLGARISLAFGFSILGAKLGLIGTAIDGAALVKDEPNKWKAILSGKIFKKLISEPSHSLSENELTDVMSVAKESMKATANALKYTLIIGTVASVAAAILGWVRGDRIRNSNDIIKHPITSLKLVLGLEKPQEPEKINAPAKKEAASEPVQESSEASTKWRDRSSQQQTMAAGM